AIDDTVEKEAFDNNAWEKGKKVKPRLSPTSIRLSNRTIAKAKFFARLHRERGYQTWLKKIIEERINTEYEIYKKIKKGTI
ncbi:MAG: hypothetical protein ACYSTT_17775, partial [Planctomycetota bacterium]